MRIALLQNNPTLGTFEDNAANLLRLARAAQTNSDTSAPPQQILCLTPEGALTGHPWRALLRTDAFAKRCAQSVRAMAQSLKTNASYVEEPAGSNSAFEAQKTVAKPMPPTAPALLLVLPAVVASFLDCELPAPDVPTSDIPALAPLFPNADQPHSTEQLSGQAMPPSPFTDNFFYAQKLVEADIDKDSMIFALLRDGEIQLFKTDAQGLLFLPDITLWLPKARACDDSKTCIVPQSDPTLTGQRTGQRTGQIDAALFVEPTLWLPQSCKAREHQCATLARRCQCPVWSVNLWGATDGSVYGGHSCAFLPDGTLLDRTDAFAEGIVLANCKTRHEHAENGMAPFSSVYAQRPAPPKRLEGIFLACVLAIRDYVRKCGLKGALIGLSGGMDSALVSCMAVEALGADHVLAVLMPSPWSSDHSLTDASVLAQNLGIRAMTAPIGDIMQSCGDVLTPLFGTLPTCPGDLTAENIQPRIRGLLLMAFANRLNYLTLAPGNKSELAVGYSTLYGDTVGGLAPIGDIYKTEVYRLARWYNTMRKQQIIPEHIFAKAPSAELRPGQTDQDSLPPYDVLDAVLHAILEEGRDPAALRMPGVEDSTIRDIARRVATAEFKRHQTPPVVRLSACALGEDWRLPAASRPFLLS